jgi:hypothetical protein
LLKRYQNCNRNLSETASEGAQVLQLELDIRLGIRGKSGASSELWRVRKNSGREPKRENKGRKECSL